MTKDETKRLPHGLYRIKWKGDENTSLAAIGSTCDGTRWFAPTNWVCASSDAPLIASTKWRMVESVQRLNLK